MTIVITGASGQLGRATAEAVLERADPSELILVTRDPQRLAGFAERGVAVRAGDFDDPGSLPAAFEGGDRLLLISTHVIGERLPQHLAAVDAAVAAGVGSIAYTSMVNPSDSNPEVVVHDHRPTEEAIRASGLDWTFLRNAIYAEVLLQSAAGALASGQMISNDGQGRCAYVARGDCAVAAAVVLTGDGHGGKAYDITGPESLSAEDVAALFAEVGERPVQVLHLTDDEWVQAMVKHASMPEPLARSLSTFGIATRRGYNACVSTTFEDLTGHPPHTASQVLLAHRAELAPA
jgi:NAD(P)H dehydrogenase (quinone)